MLTGEGVGLDDEADKAREHAVVCRQGAVSPAQELKIGDDQYQYT
jgi:hypothetical protein